MNRAAQMVRVRKTSARNGFKTRPRPRSPPLNESTVRVQTGQTFPHVLEMRGSIRSAAPPWKRLLTLRLLARLARFVFAVSHILAQAS